MHGPRNSKLFTAPPDKPLLVALDWLNAIHGAHKVATGARSQLTGNETGFISASSTAELLLA